MATAVFLTLVFLFCKANSQIYGPGPIYPGNPGPCGPCASEIYGSYGPYGIDTYLPSIPNIVPVNQPFCAPEPCMQPILNIPAPSFIQNQIPCSNLINQPILANPPCAQQIFNVPQLTPSVIQNPVPCGTTPVVATTIVDNTLANSLANAIQLLIVSNLIENTLGSSCGSNIAQTLGFLDTPCVNNFEVVTPDFYPAAQVIACECPCIDSYTPCINEVPFYQEPVVFQPPCMDVCSCSPNFGPGFAPYPVIGDCNGFGFDNCGCNICGNPYCIDPCSNMFGPSFGPAIAPFGCIEPACSIAPMAVEVPFPAAIPAQLTCNFGYLTPTNTPCVSFNVDPLPFDSCNNFFANFGNGNYY